MRRIRAAASLLASLALAAATTGPALAESLPATLSITATPSHYLGGSWEHQIAFNVSCEGSDMQEVWVNLPGSASDVLAALAPVPAGTTCWVAVSYWPDPGWNAAWEEPMYTPSSVIVLDEGDNTLTVDLPRDWTGEWPPSDDEFAEHVMQLTVDRVYLNSRGGIEVEGTSWCPDAADVLIGDFEGDLYADARWTALQYVGRKGAAITASYDSAIAHPCWVGSDPDHGPYSWQTRYPYPDGSLRFVYSVNGKFGSGWIHVEATSSTETVLVTQSFAPGGWTSWDGTYVPYDEFGVDNDGDGWSVGRHAWFGWDPADLKPIRVR
jgi:hypothetical protein